MRLSPWIEAMRLRTLPVSTAGVLAGMAVALSYRQFHWLPALICLVFAIAAQIVSNFANEYFDYKNGLDRKGRQGFRRGVTEGDIKPETMKKVMLALLVADSLLGCSLIYWGGWWLLAAGIVIVAASLAYSAGPWPLSHHGLGDEMVIIFYGVVPVTLTAYLQCGGWTGGAVASQIGPMWKMALIVSIGVGLLANNVLTVNNIRDMRDDRRVGKRTKAVIYGVPAMRVTYIIFTYVGLALIWWAMHPVLSSLAWTGYVAVGIWFVPVIIALFKFNDFRLNKVLKYTALLMLIAILWTLGLLIGERF